MTTGIQKDKKQEQLFLSPAKLPTIKRSAGSSVALPAVFFFTTFIAFIILPVCYGRFCLK